MQHVACSGAKIDGSCLSVRPMAANMTILIRAARRLPIFETACPWWMWKCRYMCCWALCLGAAAAAAVAVHAFLQLTECCCLWPINQPKVLLFAGCPPPQPQIAPSIILVNFKCSPLVPVNVEVHSLICAAETAHPLSLLTDHRMQTSCVNRPGWMNMHPCTRQHAIWIEMRRDKTRHNTYPLLF